MSIRQAVLADLSTVKHIAETTISEIYPHYYPEGAVDFFLEHHSKEKILQDIERNRVFLSLDNAQNVTGTVTIHENEISRLFVLPHCQGRGFGTELLDFAERTISEKYARAVLDASLPAKKLYLRRGYGDVDFHILPVKGNDFLCYDVMEKQVRIL